MGIEVKKPEDFDILFIGGEQLKQDTAEMVAAGKAKFFATDSKEAKEILDSHPELQAGEIAIVAAKDSEKGEACVISAVGNSLIVHCEQVVIPVKEPKPT